MNNMLDILPYMRHMSDPCPQLESASFVATADRMVQLSRRDCKIPPASYRLTIKKLQLSASARVAVVGDIHGGLCNLRNFLVRLRHRGFFKKGNQTRYRLRKGHHIVSLGDLVDRGPSSLQVLHLLLTLKTDICGNWDRVHILNGNHEEASMYNSEIGFAKEMMLDSDFVKLAYQQGVLRTENGDNILTPLEYLPSALFVRYNQEAWLQMCHGGIDLSLQDTIGGFLTNEETILHITHNDAGELIDLRSTMDTGLRWSDFHAPTGCNPGRTVTLRTDDDVVASVRGEGVWDYGTVSTGRYLCRVGVGMILRGHQDMVEGFMAVPYPWSKPQCNMRLTAHMFPIISGRVCKPLDDEPVAHQSENVVGWARISDCGGDFLDAGYDHCVPSTMCNRKGENREYVFNSSEIAVLTTATCTEARGSINECFVIVSSNPRLKALPRTARARRPAKATTKEGGTGLDPSARNKKRDAAITMQWRREAQQL